MRCFVAIEIDAACRQAVMSAVNEVRPMTAVAGGRISWARPSGWHVTLKFLGDVADDGLDAVRGELGAAVRGFDRFETVLSGLASWPHGNRARVLVVGVEDAGNTAQLAHDIDDALAPLGFAPETREYVPHLTVARLRDAAAVRSVALATRGYEETRFGKMSVERIGLYESTLEPDGAKYRRIEDYALALQ